MYSTGPFDTFNSAKYLEIPMARGFMSLQLLCLLKLITFTTEWISEERDRIQAYAEPTCDKTTTLCCEAMRKDGRYPELWKSYHPGMSSIYGEFAQLVGLRHIHFKCCIVNPGGTHDQGEIIECGGPFGMKCPVGHRVMFIQLEYMEFDHSGFLQPVDNAAGVCVENEGYSTTIIRSGSTYWKLRRAIYHS